MSRPIYDGPSTADMHAIFRRIARNVEADLESYRTPCKRMDPLPPLEEPRTHGQSLADFHRGIAEQNEAPVRPYVIDPITGRPTLPARRY